MTGRAAPSPWVVRWHRSIPAAGPVLDVACGAGRHAHLLAHFGHPVVAVDRDVAALATLAGVPGIVAREYDLEASAWPFEPRSAAGIVVTNYLHRPLLAAMVETLAPGGLLIYETFAMGNERFGKPSNPAFLLRPGELFAAVFPALHVLAYEDTVLGPPRPAAVQRIAARRPGPTV